MTEPDDRLAGDLVWELFSARAPELETTRACILHMAEIAFLIVLAWFLSQPLAVVIACLAFSLKDFRDGWRLARSIPDKAGGGVCSLFTYSWGAWKFGVTAFAAFLGIAAVNVALLREKNVPSGAGMAFLLVLVGFLTSTMLTASALLKALRSGMRVWIGEGMNQARTLILALLIVIFTFCVLIPIAFSPVITGFPGVGGGRNRIPFELIGLVVSIFAGPVVILMILDRIGRRILADRPGKFGPKVPTVGKWDK